MARGSRASAALAPADRAVKGASDWVGDRLTQALGGRARRRVIVLLACVMSLDSADKGTVGALAPQLERQFHIGNTDLGLLITASSLVGLLVTLPMGALADRVNRVHLLTAAIVSWAAATLVSSLSTSYEMLLASRLALGALIATAGPAVASLTGDFFPASIRGRMYGYMLTGELLGSGAGLLVSGSVGSALSWRVGFALMAIPSLALAVAVHRLLPEPARGGQSVLHEGDAHIVPADEAADRGNAAADSAVGGPDQDARPAPNSRIAEEAARRSDVPKEIGRRPPEEPARLNIWQAAKYVLSIPSNRIFIATSALGYFFLGGVRSFAVIFARGHFGIGQGTVSLLLVLIGAGAVVGTLTGGRLADRLIRKGTTDARVLVAGAGFLIATLLFVPGLVSTSMLLAVPLIMVAAVFLAAPNPPLDSARLDVMPSGMWGRGESVRTFVRTSFESFSPLLFGFVSHLFGATAVGFGAGVDSSHAGVSQQNAHGLQLTFLVMLLPLALSGVLLLRKRKSYLADAAATRQ